MMNECRTPPECKGGTQAADGVLRKALGGPFWDELEAQVERDEELMALKVGLEGSLKFCRGDGTFKSYGPLV